MGKNTRADAFIDPQGTVLLELNRDVVEVNNGISRIQRVRPFFTSCGMKLPSRSRGLW